MRLFIALFAFTTPIVAEHPGPVVISELMWSGSSASSADEWIELYNRSNATVDLSGWTLTRGSDDAIMLVLETGSIAAGGVFLIANYAADHEKSRLAAHPHHVTTAVSLPNTKLPCDCTTAIPWRTGVSSIQPTTGEVPPWLAMERQKRRWCARYSIEPATNQTVGRQRQNKADGMRVPANGARRDQFPPVCCQIIQPVSIR